MRKLIYILVITTLSLFNTISSAYNSDPSIFISELMDDTNNILSDKNISKIDKNKKIKDIALENIDINALGMYTLGNIRKTLDEDTLKKYKDLFEKYFLKNLTSRLTEYSENNLEIVSADQKSKTYLVH
jgi:ABC-type transporter MlaC component